MNTDILEGKGISANQIIESAEILPFMAEKRLVIVKNSGLFTVGRKNDTEIICNFINKIPDTTCIVFVEDHVDKRNKLFKKINSMNCAVTLETPKESDLITWIKREFKKNNKDIDNKTSIYMLRIVGTSMENLSNEIKKLSSYAKDKNEINLKDIEDVCTKSLEAHIFDLLKAMGYKKIDKALEIYSNLIFLKEPPIRILTMITRQIRLILQVKYLYEQGFNAKQISTNLKQPFFVVNDCIKQSKLFTIKKLKMAMKDCLEIDIASKTGKIDPQIAIEMFLIKYSK